MIDEFKRSAIFLRKAWRAGFIPVELGTMSVRDIRYPISGPWLEAYMHGTDHSVYATPHYSLLERHVIGGIRFHSEPFGVFHASGQQNFGETDYWRHQVSLRGIDHPRPDHWITAMGQRFVGLYESIKWDGYRHRCIADRIAVTTNGVLWDGGHRLACLAALGWERVPVVKMWRFRP